MLLVHCSEASVDQVNTEKTVKEEPQHSAGVPNEEPNEEMEKYYSQIDEQIEELEFRLDQEFDEGKIEKLERRIKQLQSAKKLGPMIGFLKRQSKKSKRD